MIFLYMIYIYIVYIYNIFIYTLGLNKINNDWSLHCVYGLIPNFRWLKFFYFPKKKIHRIKNETIYVATRNVQSEVQTYCLNKRFNMSYHFTF